MSMYKRKYEDSNRKGSESRRHYDDRDEERRKDKEEKEKDDSDGEPKKQKMQFSIGAMKKPAIGIASKPTLKAINIKLEPQKTQVSAVKSTLQSVFNSDSEEEEEMPPEAKMRMRNIGRETPTSAGPNSFGKTKHGFCNAQKVFEKNLKKAALEAGESDK